MNKSKQIEVLELQVQTFLDKITPSKNAKYHRRERFEYKIRPNWTAMCKFTRANTTRRTAMLINWCDKHCQGDYSYDGVRVGFSFKLKSDAALFKLTWG